MARDNFSQQVRQKLQDLAGGLCSNPDCQQATVAVATDGVSSAGIGVAAHIHAASPGGPRYLATMSNAERAAANNGLWLCYSCSVKIDRDETAYPAELLKDWKRWAASQARQRIGRRRYSDDDVQKHLTSALTGFPSKFFPTAIANTHAATAASLQLLDPRIKVTTEFRNGVTHIDLRALERIDASFSLKPKYPELAKEKFSAFLEQGESFEVEVDELTFTGSPILEQIAREGGNSAAKFELVPESSSAEACLVIRPVGATTPSRPIIVSGRITPGHSAATFVGTAWDGLFRFKQVTPYSKEYRSHLTFNIEFGVEVWQGIRLIELPYLKRVFEVADALANDFEVSMSLDVRGEEVMTQQFTKAKKHEDSVHIARHLYFVCCAATVAERLCPTATYQVDHTISKELFDTVTEIADIIERPHVQVPSTISMTVAAERDAANIRLMLESTEESLFKIVQEGCQFDLFGSPVTTGRLQTILKGYTATTDKKFDEIKEGDNVVLVWQPGEQYQVVRALLPADADDLT